MNSLDIFLSKILFQNYNFDKHKIKTEAFFYINPPDNPIINLEIDNFTSLSLLYALAELLQGHTHFLILPCKGYYYVKKGQKFVINLEFEKGLLSLNDFINNQPQYFKNTDNIDKFIASMEDLIHYMITKEIMIPLNPNNIYYCKDENFRVLLDLETKKFEKPSIDQLLNLIYDFSKSSSHEKSFDLPPSITPTYLMYRQQYDPASIYVIINFAF